MSPCGATRIDFGDEHTTKSVTKLTVSLFKSKCVCSERQNNADDGNRKNATAGGGDGGVGAARVVAGFVLEFFEHLSR